MKGWLTSQDRIIQVDFTVPSQWEGKMREPGMARKGKWQQSSVDLK